MAANLEVHKSQPLAQRHALVTGAGQGIGAAIALALAADGARVTLLGRRAEPLQALAAQQPGQMQWVQADVTDAAQLETAIEQARQRFGPVQILINNAGQAASAPLLKTSAELWQQMLAVNLTGTFLGCQAALPDMLQTGWGRIVNIASTAGLKGYAYVSAYCAAKHGVIGLTRALAQEVAQKGISVNAVCPGYTDTPLLDDSLQRMMAKTGRSEADLRAELAQGNPQARLILPEQVAQTVRWLCSEAASAVHGQAIAVDGGETMR
jgi:2-hydroxycyclohexanecarboxyl-CoA dehydrogenase